MESSIVMSSDEEKYDKNKKKANQKYHRKRTRLAIRLPDSPNSDSEQDECELDKINEKSKEKVDENDGN